MLAVVAVLSNCSKDEDEPETGSVKILAIDPDKGQVGTLVVISGSGFSIDDTENTVKFNGVEADVQLSSTTSIAVTVPSGTTTGAVTVTTGGKTVTGPVFTLEESPQEVSEAYYLKFKANGTVKIFEAGNPGFQSCGQCACCYLPVLSDDRNSSLNICNDNNNWITAAHIQSWNGDKILFNNGGVFPEAEFSFTENGIYYSTGNAADQTGSEVNITSVVADGEYLGLKAYKVTGNFKCKVNSSDEMSPFTITEGTFVIRYSED
jgi:hypothetical protein